MQDNLQQLVERMVAAGESEADIALVIQHYKAQSKPAEPPPASSRGASIVADPNPLMRIGRTAINNPGTAGAMVAGALTGGAGILGSAAAGAGGALAGHALKGAATGHMDEGVLGDVALNAGLGAAGPLLGQALKIAGRGAYRAGLLPIQSVLGKYKDVVGTGIKEAVPVTKGGLAKATKLKDARLADKAERLGAADERLSYSTKNVTDDVLTELGPAAGRAKKAGMGNPMPKHEATAEEILAANGPEMKPTQLEDIKRTWDDNLGGAFQKVREKKPLSAKEQFGTQLTKTASRYQEAAVPEYRQLNKDIMDAAGLERAIRRRTEGSAGNQGLENALTMLGGLKALPARIAMLPPVMSGIGIGLDRAGQAVAPTAAQALRALVLALSGDQQQEE